MKTAATNDRNLLRFLLMAQLDARAIGARIKQARREASMTQEQVADVATFSKRSLQDYENGVTIPYRHLRELGALLDRPTEWFLHGRSEAEAEGTVPTDHRLDDIEEKIDRLTAIVERMVGSRRSSQDGQDDHPSSETNQ